MGRRLRTKLPVNPLFLKPNLQESDRHKVQLKEDEYRSNQQKSHDKRHRAKELPPLAVGDRVWVRDQNREGQIINVAEQPRSYVVQTDKSAVRRNQSALITTNSEDSSPTSPATPPILTQSSSQQSEEPPAEPLSSSVRTPGALSKDTNTPTVSPPPQTPLTTSPRPPERVTRCGRVIKTPQRLNL